MKTTVQAMTGVVLGFVICWSVTAIGDWWNERSRVRVMQISLRGRSHGDI